MQDFLVVFFLFPDSQQGRKQPLPALRRVSGTCFVLALGWAHRYPASSLAIRLPPLYLPVLLFRELWVR